MVLQSCANLFLLDQVVPIVWPSKVFNSGADVIRMIDRHPPPQRAVTVPMRNNVKGIQSL